MGGITTIGGRPSSGGGGGDTGSSGGSVTVSGIQIGQAVQGAGGTGMLPLDGRVLNKSSYSELNAAMTAADGGQSDFYTSNSVASLTNAQTAYHPTLNMFVGIASNQIQYSQDDGATWTVLTLGFPLQNFFGIVCDGTRFIAVGAQYALVSTDGLTWQQSVLPSSAQALTQATVVYSNGKVRVFSDLQRLSMTSVDGLNWTLAGIPLGFVNKIVFTGVNYVAYGQYSNVVANTGASKVAISADGETWSIRNLAGADQINGIATANGVVCLFSSSRLHRSADHGETWTMVANPFGTGSISSCTSTNGVMLVSGLLGSVNSVYQSADGVTWTQVTGGVNSITFKGIAYSPELGKYVTSMSGTSIALISSDMASWEIVNLPMVSDWSTVIWTGTRFAILSDVGLATVNSTDGVNWVQGGNAPTGAKRPNWAGNVTNNMFVVLFNASGTALISSPDGITWTSRTLPASSTWQSIACKGTMFVATNAGATTASSPDGITWTARTGTSNTSITASDTLFVGVKQTTASAAIVWTSTDGITWVSRSIATVSNFQYNSVWWNGSVFIIMQTNGGVNVQTSPDGINWTAGSFVPNLGSVQTVPPAWNQGTLCFTWQVRGGAYQVGTNQNDPTGTNWNVKSTPHMQMVAQFGSNGSTVVGLGGGLVQTLASGASAMTYKLLNLKEGIHQSYFTDILWTGDQFVAAAKSVLAENNPFYLTSPDGVAWTKHSAPVVSQARPLFVNGRIMIIGATASYGKQDDGSWKVTNHPLGTTNYLIDSSQIGNKGFMFANMASSTTNMNNHVPSVTTDGLTMNHSLPLMSFNSWTTAVKSSTIVTFGAYVVSTSTDGGDTWTYRGLPFTIAAVNYNPVVDAFFAIPSASGSRGLYSKDGLTWRVVNLPATAVWSAIGSFGKTMVAAANTTAWAYSNNGGLDWYTMNNPYSGATSWQTLQSSPTAMIALGTGNAMSYAGTTGGMAAAVLRKTFDETTQFQLPAVSAPVGSPQWFVKAK